MAKHEFGIMQKAPSKNRRYDKYEPQKYNCISVRDDDLDNIIMCFDSIIFFSHTVAEPIMGLNYCGITLIPPKSMQAFISVIDGISNLSELKSLMQKAYDENKWVIHFGV